MVDIFMVDQPLSGTGWRLARSLVTLRDEVNAFAPGRSRAADGTIGDAAHAARSSRHNPNAHGVVTALDVTHDPAGGMDVHALARRLVLHPHPDLCYVISARQIAMRAHGWEWRPYTGSSPHTAHAHFAVGGGLDADPRPPYDDTDPWGVAPPQQEDDMTPQEHEMLAFGAIFALQGKLDANIAKAYAKGDAAAAAKLSAERNKTIDYWSRRWGIDSLGEGV